MNATDYALQAALEDLARSGIPPEAAGHAGYAVADDATEVHPSYAPQPALVLPYYDVTGAPVLVDGEPFSRIRYLGDPPTRPGKSPFHKRKGQRYAQPPESGVHAYFPPVAGLDWAAVANDTKQPLLIVEGEKKALAATLAGFATVGLGGVWNYTSGGVLLPELDAFKWKGRVVYIVFDSDAAQNAQIQAAEARLATELSMQRGALLHLVRLPNADDGSKQGVDDYLLSQGADSLDSLLTSAPRMRKVDSAVIALNEHVAWIEKEGLVYDLRSKEFIQKANFTSGSKYSALTVEVALTRGNGVKDVSVAEAWLKHPHARRYDYAEFRPEEKSILRTPQGGISLNMWTGWNSEPGDVQPFLDLTEFLMAELGPNKDLPLKLLAYKAQNPGIKVPLCPVLVGTQGCGKSLWAECVRGAFDPYTADIPVGALVGQFNGWVERTLIAVINEADGATLAKAAPQLRALISDKRAQLNEKYRAARQVESYTQYIITSNDRGAGAFNVDDRRMIVVSCPPKRENAFYLRIADWKNKGGGKHLLDYLLRYDLAGWRPPLMAPMTSEKYMAYMESLSPVERLAEEMQTASANVILMWIEQALAWANVAAAGNNPMHARYAAEIYDSLTSIQIRPFYTPEELALMFPAITAQMHGQPAQKARASGSISKDLRTAGIGYLRSADDPRGFQWRGSLRQFLVVAEPEEWTQPLPQAEFERLMAQFPKYRDLAAARKNGKH